MYVKIVNAWIFLALGLIETLLFQTFPAFEGLHGNIKIFVIRCLQRKLFKENERQGEHKHTIVDLFKQSLHIFSMLSDCSQNCF